MPTYRTEIVVPPDRYVCLQLPPDLPEGPAHVTLRFDEPTPGDEPRQAPEADVDRTDIEWWEEFEADTDPNQPPAP